MAETSPQFKVYYSWRPYLWTGDLLEWQSNTVLGCIIRMFTGKDVNHTGLVIRYMNFDTERVYTLEALAKGFYPNLLSKRLARYKGRLYWLQLLPSLDEYRPVIAREAMKYIGTGYDFSSLIKQVLVKVKVSPEFLFCSEGAYISYRDAKVPFKPYNPNMDLSQAPQPGNFKKLGIFKERIRIF